MKTLLLCLGLLLPVLSMAQHKTGKEITVLEAQKDDIYLAGETININVPVEGDVVVAGGNITIRDSVHQDLIIAGGEITVNGYVVDDIRAAGGKFTIDSEVGDDLVVAGGEVFLTKNAIIHGNLINFSGKINMNGEVKGMVKSYAGDLVINGKVAQGTKLHGEDVLINGEIRGESEIVAETIVIGEGAKFYGDVTYWSEDGEVDFKNSIVNGEASYSEGLKEDRNGFSMEGFGIAAIGLWIFYLFSAFLVLLLLNLAFGNLFSKAVVNFDKAILKSFGYGLIYLFGVPLLIVITFVIIIGIPIGLFLSGFYLFSILFGHLVSALLISHYLHNRSNTSWNFWTVVFLALGIAAVIRLLTLIPVLGIVISVLVIALGYGILALTLLQNRTPLKIKVE